MSELPLCDFHVPSIIRRGKLLLTASTGGMSPALARRLREFLAARFAPVWADRLEIIGAARHKWRDEGLSFGEVTTIILSPKLLWMTLFDITSSSSSLGSLDLESIGETGADTA